MIFENNISNQKLKRDVIQDGLKLSLVTSMKFFEVIIDNRLNWKPHINSLISKVKRNAAVTGRIRHNIDSRTALLLYDSMMAAHICYCFIICVAISHNKLKKYI